jgi:hypothetical protein
MWSMKRLGKGGGAVGHPTRIGAAAPKSRLARRGGRFHDQPRRHRRCLPRAPHPRPVLGVDSFGIYSYVAVWVAILSLLATLVFDLRLCGCLA